MEDNQVENGTTTRILLGLMTGSIGTLAVALCRFCQEEEETAILVLCYYGDLTNLI